MSTDQINGLNIPDSLKAKLVPYAGLKGQDAVNYLAQNPLTITQDEANALDQAVQTPLVNQLRSNYDAATSAGSFDGLPDQAQTVITSVATQYGPALSQATPNFWSKVTAKDWPGAVAVLRNFGDAYPTRRNKEADLLQTIYQMMFGPVVANRGTQRTSYALNTGELPMSGSFPVPSLVSQFRWPLIFGGLLIGSTYLRTCFPDQGVFERSYNSLIAPLRSAFTFVGPYFVLLSTIEALFGPSIRWIWNRRLLDQVQYLQRRGGQRQARQLAAYRLTLTKWTAVVSLLLALMGLLVTLTNWTPWMKASPAWVERGFCWEANFTQSLAFVIACGSFIAVLWIERLLGCASFMWGPCQDPESFLDDVAAEGSQKN